MVTRNLAWEKVCEWIENTNLRKHCLAVEASMIAYALKLGVGDNNELENWRIAGLIHDADWEIWPDEHPAKVLAWLKEQSADEKITNAVASHSVHFGVEPESSMAKVLGAVDELTGLIVAVALVKPEKKLQSVTIYSILNKWNDKSFAKGVNRQDLEKATARLGIPLQEHIQISLQAMQSIADTLGL